MLWPSSPEDKAKIDQELEAATRKVRAERLVKNRLRDPDSATFKHYTNGCGSVNAKNGFGGMTGEQNFVIDADGRALLPSDGRFEKAWRALCK